jgi:hypothetical protein
MKKTGIVLLSLFIGLTSFIKVNAQKEFEVPQSVELKTKDDYAKYETAIIEAAKWLEETDLNKEADKRQQVNSFIIQWISGSPTVSVDITEQLAKVYGKNVQLLALYLASYSKEYLENKNTATKFSATKAGLISMMNVYKKGIEISKSKEMDKLIKMTSDNKLDEYINNKLM